MIYLSLFLSFLKIGAFTFGGGYAMISLIRETTLANGWLSEEELLNFIAVSESTPGPIAINMATFIGSSQGGVLGALCATLGVVLPSFVIILLIAALIRNFMKLPAVQATLLRVRPCVVGLILSTAGILLCSTLFGVKTVSDGFSPNVIGIVIFVLAATVGTVYKRLRKKTLSPILLIAGSAVLGGVLYSL